MGLNQIITSQRRMFRLDRFIMRRRHNQQIRPRCFSCKNPHRRIFEHQAVADLYSQPFCGEPISARVRFADTDVFGSDHHIRLGNPGRRHAPQRQRSRCGGDDGPLMSRQRLEKLRRAGHLFNPFDIFDFRLGDPRRFCFGIDTGQRQALDGIDGAGAVNGRQEGFDIDTVAHGPSSPDPFSGGNRGEDGAVHVEQEGAVRRIEDRGLSGQGKPRRCRGECAGQCSICEAVEGTADQWSFFDANAPFTQSSSEPIAQGFLMNDT
ncbi:hypothetical protein D3C72_499400 [compost metagenome]